jgi:hypothetical protein
MIVYVITAIGALWGILTLIGISQEDKEIQELLESARNATRQSHGSE